MKERQLIQWSCRLYESFFSETLFINCSTTAGEATWIVHTSVDQKVACWRLENIFPA